MKTIVIPTDFTVASLQLIEYAVLNFPNNKLNIILLAGCKLPENRWAVTYFHEGEYLRKLCSDEFNVRKQHITLEHSDNIGFISCKLFTGVNVFAFQNFMEPLYVDYAIVPKEKTLYCSNNKWFDVTKFIAQNCEHVIEVPITITEEAAEKKFSLVSIFNL